MSQLGKFCTVKDHFRLWMIIFGLALLTSLYSMDARCENSGLNSQPIKSIYYGEFAAPVTNTYQGEWVFACTQRPKSNESYPFHFHQIAHGGRKMYLLNLEFNDLLIPDHLKAEYLKHLENALSCAEVFFAENNLPLVLNLNSQSANHQILLLERGESHKNQLAFIDPQSNQLRSPEALCSLVAHEVSHHLGVADFYPDQLCPYRFQGEEDWLMTSGSKKSIYELKLSFYFHYIFNFNKLSSK